MNLPKEIDRLSNKTGITYEIRSTWNGEVGFYFDCFYDTANNIHCKKMECSDNLEDGLEWLHRQYKQVEK